MLLALLLNTLCRPAQEPGPVHSSPPSVGAVPPMDPATRTFLEQVFADLQSGKASGIGVLAGLPEGQLTAVHERAAGELDWSKTHLALDRDLGWLSQSEPPITQFAVSDDVNTVYIGVERDGDLPQLEVRNLIYVGDDPCLPTLLVTSDETIQYKRHSYYQKGIDPESHQDPLRPGQPDPFWKVADRLARTVVPLMDQAPFADAPELGPQPSEALLIWSAPDARFWLTQRLMEVCTRAGIGIWKIRLCCSGLSEFVAADLPHDSGTIAAEPCLRLELDPKDGALWVRADCASFKEGMGDWPVSDLEAKLKPQSGSGVQVVLDPAPNLKFREVVDVLLQLRRLGFRNIHFAVARE